MIVFCNKKLKRIENNGKIKWSINFKAPGWEFLAGMGFTLAFFGAYFIVSFIEQM